MASVPGVQVEAQGQAQQEAEALELMPLGAGSEVGRSCVIARYKGKNVMFDCGIHPGLSGLASLPFLDEVELEKIDVILVTHFHLDHCAALPYVISKTKFRGRVFMTHPTKAVYKMLLADFVKVSKHGSADALYTDKDLELSMDRIEVIDFHQEIDLDGILIKPYMAGHVLGAAMFQVEIAGVRVLYTGDYSRKADRHLAGAELPDQPPHVVIVESTYGVQTHGPREERERRFLDMVVRVLRRRGKVLLPVVALGRAQELLLILDECWERMPELRNVPIYQASALARRSLSVYQTYINMMSEEVRASFEVANPFVFKHVQHLQSSSQFDDVGSCVVLATPSMLQSGLSRELFESWCEDRRNGVIIADFAVQGTLAREILSAPTEITTRAGAKVPLRMTVESISFSAHADFPQTQDFIEKTHPPHVMLVHGEPNEMNRLKRGLEQHAAVQERPLTVHTPKNCQVVKLPFRVDKVAKVMGAAAMEMPVEGASVSGLLVRKGFTHTVVQPQDLADCTPLTTSTITQRQLVPTSRPFVEVRFALEALFEGMEQLRVVTTKVDGPAEQASAPAEEGDVKADGEAAAPSSTKPAADAKAADEQPPRQALRVGEWLIVEEGERRPGAAPHVVLQWESDPVADMLADSVVAIILQMQDSPIARAETAREAALRAEDMEGVRKAELEIVHKLMQAHFGPAQLDEEAGCIAFETAGAPCTVHHQPHPAMALVECVDEALKTRVERVLKRLEGALRPVVLPNVPSHTRNSNLEPGRFVHDDAPNVPVVAPLEPKVKS